MRQTLWEKLFAAERILWRFLIKSLRPENVKPMKTTSKAYPVVRARSAATSSTVIVEHQQQMIESYEETAR